MNAACPSAHTSQQTHVARFFGSLDHLRSLRRRLDVWRRWDRLGRRGTEELVHIVEGIVVDAARLTGRYIVGKTSDNGVGLGRVGVGNGDGLEGEGNGGVWEGVEEGL